jgi:hypothetical protein
MCSSDAASTDCTSAASTPVRSLPAAQPKATGAPRAIAPTAPGELGAVAVDDRPVQREDLLLPAADEDPAQQVAAAGDGDRHAHVLQPRAPRPALQPRAVLGGPAQVDVRAQPRGLKTAQLVALDEVAGHPQQPPARDRPALDRQAPCVGDEPPGRTTAVVA